MTRLLAGLFLAWAILLPQVSWANRAQAMLVPTRVVIEDKDRYSTILVRNTGNATGDFAIEMVDMTMGEEGGIEPLKEGQSDPYSAQPYVRIAPHSMTLKPGEAQNVRVMIRKPEGMAPGEYRSHLRLSIVNDNVEAKEAEKKAAPEEKKGNIAVKINMVMVIPLIVRHGETTLSMKFESAKIGKDTNGKPVATMVLLREGNRSSMGDFKFTHTPPGGVAQEIKFFPGVPVYRSATRRVVTVPLNDIPAGVDLTKGKLDILYAAQEKEDRKKLAEIQINLGG